MKNININIIESQSSSSAIALASIHEELQSNVLSRFEKSDETFSFITESLYKYRWPVITQATAIKNLNYISGDTKLNFTAYPIGTWSSEIDLSDGDCSILLINPAAMDIKIATEWILELCVYFTRISDQLRTVSLYKRIIYSACYILGIDKETAEQSAINFKTWYDRAFATARDVFIQGEMNLIDGESAVVGNKRRYFVYENGKVWFVYGGKDEVSSRFTQNFDSLIKSLINLFIAERNRIKTLLAKNPDIGIAFSHRELQDFIPSVDQYAIVRLFKDLSAGSNRTIDKLISEKGIDLSLDLASISDVNSTFIPCNLFKPSNVVSFLGKNIINLSLSEYERRSQICFDKLNEDRLINKGIKRIGLIYLVIVLASSSSMIPFEPYGYFNPAFFQYFILGFNFVVLLFILVLLLGKPDHYFYKGAKAILGFFKIKISKIEKSHNESLHRTIN